MNKENEKPEDTLIQRAIEYFLLGLLKMLNRRVLELKIRTNLITLEQLKGEGVVMEGHVIVSTIMVGKVEVGAICLYGYDPQGKPITLAVADIPHDLQP